MEVITQVSPIWQEQPCLHVQFNLCLLNLSQKTIPAPTCTNEDIEWHSGDCVCSQIQEQMAYIDVYLTQYLAQNVCHCLVYLAGFERFWLTRSATCLCCDPHGACSKLFVARFSELAVWWEFRGRVGVGAVWFGTNPSLLPPVVSSADVPQSSTRGYWSFCLQKLHPSR